MKSNIKEAIFYYYAIVCGKIIQKHKTYIIPGIVPYTTCNMVLFTYITASIFVWYNYKKFIMWRLHPIRLLVRYRHNIDLFSISQSLVKEQKVLKVFIQSTTKSVNPPPAERWSA